MGTLGLLGDVMLGRSLARALRQAPPERVWSEEVIELCAGCDAVVCNLECCISERGTATERIPGKPFFFRAPPAAVDALGAVGATAVSLANNHALDYEEEALLDTLEHLAAADITAVGAGADVERARRGGIVATEDLRVGLVAATDHPREYAAETEAPGVAWADLRAELPEWVRDELRRLRAEADLVIAFPHWGPNMTTEPARWQRGIARELVAAGADLVAGHSAHVFHGVGRVRGRAILYDLGDALDDYAVDAALRNDLGVLFLVELDPALRRIEAVPLRLDYARTRLAPPEDARLIARLFAERCARLGTAVDRVGERLVVAPA